ncbi:hypothetical protein M427DRAFT_131399 [Gonapodya prolifera JEL478]|uniref:Uncharacterized protein n=1 Tax=Gonapodya prolifera (strain JEL478) TaxID=1344416 RepID=A0A139AV78_GONPJ|nr:hypothetical protein M427DRAFT_131399 [Gonapodya prolifera JEL478]|eukprot:KXS20640.1 hypothetical protein M427DRAFT_131399 [Gonapodya prolifera JEL478]
MSETDRSLSFALGALRRSGAPGVVQQGPAPDLDVFEIKVYHPSLSNFTDAIACLNDVGN